MSCLNYGLQVATGASLGRGAIEIAGPESRLEAEFIYRDRRLRLTLKPAWQERMRDDIEAAVAKYGRNTPEYFSRIRGLSVQYWLMLDRKEIFDEVWE